MVRVAARALALACRRVAGHADRAVTRPAAGAFPAAASTAVIAARFAGAVRRAARPELRARRLRARAAAAALVGVTGHAVGLAAIRERVAIADQGQYDGDEEERSACELCHRALPVRARKQSRRQERGRTRLFRGRGAASISQDGSRGGELGPTRPTRGEAGTGTFGAEREGFE